MKPGEIDHEELGVIQMWQMPAIPALRWQAQEGPSNFEDRLGFMVRFTPIQINQPVNWSKVEPSFNLSAGVVGDQRILVWCHQPGSLV